MNILSAVKCLLCLIKCSKYLYFIKKAVCFTALAVVFITGIAILSDKKSLTKKLKEMI
jgi:hypothetical protein